MKKNTTTILLILCLVISAASYVKIAALEDNFNSHRNRTDNYLSNIEQNVSRISGNVRSELEKQASLITASDWKYLDADLEQQQVTVQASVTAKEYHPQRTKATLYCNNTPYPMTLTNGEYIADIPLSLFDTCEINRVQFETDGVIQTESLYWGFSPYQDYIPTVHADMGGSSTTSNSKPAVHTLQKHLQIDINYNPDTVTTAPKLKSVTVLAYLDGELLQEYDMPLIPEQMDNYEGFITYYNDFKETFNIPKGSTLELYADVVVDDLRHRNKVDHIAISEDDDSIRAEEPAPEWWHGAESMEIYDLDGNLLYKLDESQYY